MGEARAAVARAAVATVVEARVGSVPSEGGQIDTRVTLSSERGRGHSPARRMALVARAAVARVAAVAKGVAVRVEAVRAVVVKAADRLERVQRPLRAFTLAVDTALCR